MIQTRAVQVFVSKRMSWRGVATNNNKGEVKAPGMGINLEDDLAKKLALMLESDKMPGLVK